MVTLNEDRVVGCIPDFPEDIHYNMVAEVEKIGL